MGQTKNGTAEIICVYAYEKNCLTLCPLGAEVSVQSDEGQGAVEVKELPSLSRTPPPVL